MRAILGHTSKGSKSGKYLSAAPTLGEPSSPAFASSGSTIHDTTRTTQDAETIPESLITERTPCPPTQPTTSEASAVELVPSGRQGGKEEGAPAENTHVSGMMAMTGLTNRTCSGMDKRVEIVITTE